MNMKVLSPENSWLRIGDSDKITPPADGIPFRNGVR